MQLIDKLGEIWDLQEFLNNDTLLKNGFQSARWPVDRREKEYKAPWPSDPLTMEHFRDELKFHIDEACLKQGLLHRWIQQYTLAALMEVQEYEAEVDKQDRQNAVPRQLELIDILHFIISMFQVSGMTRDEFLGRVKGPTDTILSQEDHGFGSAPQRWIKSLRNDLFLVIKMLPWKHWSKTTKFDLLMVRNQIEANFVNWLNACHTEGLSGERIYHLYVEKNKVNINRQNSCTYSEATKKPDEGHIT